MADALVVPYYTLGVPFYTGSTPNPIPILSEPGRIFGWNYHNENDFTVYIKLYNVSYAFLDPDTDIPLIRLGVPPEQASGHVFAPGGIEFDSNFGSCAYVSTSIEDIAGSGPGVDYTFAYEIYYLPETFFQ